MSIDKKKLYIILSIGLLAGYILLIVEILTHKTGRDTTPDLCFFKAVTGIPCPSCGSTRSVVWMFEGNLKEAIHINPLGLVIAAIMLVSPLWLLFDVTTGKSTFHSFYCKAEIILRKPFIAAPLIILIIINWAWNIVKGV